MIILNNFIESLIVMIFLTFYLGKNVKYNHIYLLLFTGVSTIALTYFEKIMPFEVFSTIGLILIEFIYCAFFTRRYIYEKIIACVYVELVISIIIHIIILGVMTLDAGNLLVMTYDIQRIIIIFLSKIILIIVLYISVKKRNEYFFDIQNRYLSVVIIELVTIFVITLFLSHMVFNTDVIFSIYLMIFILLLILSLFLIRNYINQLIYTQELNESKEVVQVLEERVKSFNEIKTLNKKLNSIRHDVKHQYAFIKDLLEEKKYRKISEICDYEIDSLNKLPKIHISDNYVIDYTINKSINIAKEKNIEFRYIVNIYHDIVLTEPELNAVISNSLDNAFENCSDNGYVLVNISENAKYVEIRVTNSVVEDVFINNPNLETGKEGIHGYGISNIKKIIGNNGKVIIKSDNNEFIIVIFIKINL
jgi:hypothetical protein